MRTVPKDLPDILDFVESHLAPWDVNVEKIGLTKDQIDALRAALDAARGAYDAAHMARDAARAATLKANTEIASLRALASAYVKAIRATAAWGGPSELTTAGVLALAEIPPEGDRGGGHRAPRPPGAVERLNAVVESTGAVRLTWTAKNASAGTGGYFEVFRKVRPRAEAEVASSAGEVAPSAGDYLLVASLPGLSSTRRQAVFVDQAVPAGAGSVSYVVQARRGRAAGPASAPLTVHLGGGAVRVAA